MRVLDLFSGIGGFSLGLERAGMKTVAFCEIEAFPRAVLAKHWPEVPCYDDVRTLTAERLAADGICVDAICGGFPCQDISVAGKGAGLSGERSGLWREYARLIGEIRPRWVIIENVSILRSRGLDVVLRALAALGYDAEWHCVPAAAVGAPHRRDRLWIVAHADCLARDACRTGDAQQGAGRRDLGRSGLGPNVADAGRPGLPLPERHALLGAGRREEGASVARSSWWSAEPDVGRVAHGVPRRVDRLRALGNAVVPQIPEILGAAIMRLEGARA